MQCEMLNIFFLFFLFKLFIVEEYVQVVLVCNV